MSGVLAASTDPDPRAGEDAAGIEIAAAAAESDLAERARMLEAILAHCSAELGREPAS